MSGAVAIGFGLLGLTIACLGCGDASFGHRDQERLRTAAQGETVSTVDGVSIGARELEQLAAAGKLEKREALARLQAERLLEAEARERGYGSDAAARQLVRQALVQELLRSDVEAGEIPESDLARAYAEQGARFVVPEKRVSSHVLALLTKNPTPEQEAAARAFAQNACQKLKDAENRLDALHALRAENSPSLPIKVEDLPAVADDGRFVAEFSRALFSLKEPGVVPEPVRTQFGWHAIVLTAIQPATTVPLEEARDVLRRELSAKRSQQRVDELVQRLQSQRAVHYSQAAEQTLSQLEF